MPGALATLGVHQTVADVRIDWRLVDAASRKIIKTGSGLGGGKGRRLSTSAPTFGGNGGQQHRHGQR